MTMKIFLQLIKSDRIDNNCLTDSSTDLSSTSQLGHKSTTPMTTVGGPGAGFHQVPPLKPAPAGTASRVLETHKPPTHHQKRTSTGGGDSSTDLQKLEGINWVYCHKNVSR